jgi:hypothetical protein
MDHEVMEFLRALGCFSASTVEDNPETDADAGNEFDELYCDVGGEA